MKFWLQKIEVKNHEHVSEAALFTPAMNPKKQWHGFYCESVKTQFICQLSLFFVVSYSHADCVAVRSNHFLLVE